MNSPGHRANILNKNFTEIGIATAKGYYQGRETIFVVQLFGKPIITSSVPKTVPTPTQKPTVEALPNNIESTDMFIAVKNLDIQQILQEPQKNLAGVFQDAMNSYIGKFYGIITSPNVSLAYLYLFLGILVSIGLLLMVFIEIKVQHPRHIIYGILLLLLIGGLIYINASFIADGVMII